MALIFTVARIHKIERRLPAIVIGTPVNTLLNSLQLYLASLKAPATGKITVMIIPKIPKDLKLNKEYARTAGATPKDTRSAKESSSFPSSLFVFKNLATVPSYLSKIPPSKIKRPAIV